MASTVYDARKHTFFKQDEILFDANVWVYLEGPPGAPDTLVKAYSALLESILIKGSVLVTAPLVLSEFVNVYLDTGYKAWANRRDTSKKEFRKSPAYDPWLRDVKQACRNILDRCGRTVRTAASLDGLRDDIATFSEGSYDFNDLLLARLCREERLTLVTHDADFAEMEGLTIVTANKKALRR